MKTLITTFWVVTVCGLVCGYCRVGGTDLLSSQCRRLQSSSTHVILAVTRKSCTDITAIKELATIPVEKQSSPECILSN
jgi:predicted  nucleic acid-binding Zn ribbon protein